MLADQQITALTICNGLEETRDYDANGNRLSLTGADQSHLYTYDSASNRLIGIDARDITHDVAGNTLSDGQGRQFEHNRAGRLHKVTENGTLLAVYHYNAQGQRTRKTLFGQNPRVTVYVTVHAPTQ